MKTNTSTTGTLHEDQHTFWSYLAQIFLEWEIFQALVVEKIKTHFLFGNFLASGWGLIHVRHNSLCWPVAFSSFSNSANFHGDFGREF